MTYPTKKLGEIARIQNGFAFKSSEYADSGFFVMRITNVQDGFIELNNPKYIKEGGKDFKKFVLNVNDVLISLTGNVGRVGIIQKEHLPAVLNQRVARIMVADINQLDRSYLFNFLKSPSFMSRVVEMGHGMAQKNVSTKDIENLEIPLPPIAEQRKIVARLEKLLGKIKEAKRLREEAQSASAGLLPAELHRLLTPPHNKHTNKLENVGMSPNKWGEKELGEIAILVRGPFGGSLRKDIFVNSGDCVYEQGNVIDGNLENFRYFIIPEKFSQMQRFAVSAGDILMSCSGTIGKFAIIPKKFKKGIINQALLKITPSPKITSEFLKFELGNYFSSNQSHIKGMAIKNIAAVKELKKIKIPLPPIAEQKRIVARLDALSGKTKKLQEYQNSTASDFIALEQSVLSHAFSDKI